MATEWAIDFGTTNTVVAKAVEGSVQVVEMPGLGREQPTPQPALIPSAIYLLEARKQFLFLRRTVLEARVGQQALNRNYDGRSPGFQQSFKLYLGHQPHRPATRVGSRTLSVREVTVLFFRELLRAVAEHSGERVGRLTVPAPVGFYESYRAELQTLARQLGVSVFRSLDEPVAAALGYGVSLVREQTLLVVDWGGGTLNLAGIRMGPQLAATGVATVLAKHMAPIGGNDVDRWITEHFVPEGVRDLPDWQQDLRWEAAWVKEQVSRTGSGEFRWGGLHGAMHRDDLIRLLTERGLYDQLRQACVEIRGQLAETLAGSEGRIDEVLLAGGSTLLPEVPAVVDAAFPEAVVRHDPQFVFTGVALGAARFAGGVPVEDFIYHDYALAVRDDAAQGVGYELLVPRRTRYPTPPNFAVRYYADYPGMTEVRLRVCEIGRLGQCPVQWEPRPNGNRYWAPGSEEERALAVELNPGDEPVLLRPAGRGTSPRLRVTYAIDADRWLRTTIEDLVLKRVLKAEEPVTRLR